jgi:S-adenosylmethionine:diacylglycerol 3-amino-3-carboxypropyl transferase
MFLDNTSHQPEPVAVARIYPQDLKLNKLHSANLPKLPSIAQPFHLLPNNATPRQKNLRQEILYPAQDKPTFHIEEAASSRGPKVLSKNLPDVFLSNLGSKAG